MRFLIHRPNIDYFHTLIQYVQFSFQNMFSLIRGRGGHNDNPTTVQAKAALRGVVCNNIIRSTSKGQNCEDVELHFLLPSIPAEPANTESSDDDKEILHSVTEALAKDEFDVDLDANVDEASSYVTGHAAFNVSFFVMIVRMFCVRPRPPIPSYSIRLMMKRVNCMNHATRLCLTFTP